MFHICSVEGKSATFDCDIVFVVDQRRATP
jgi:hypothetical protein